MNGVKKWQHFLESKSNSFDNKTFVPKDRNSMRWFGTQCQAPEKKKLSPSQTNKQKLKESSRSYKHIMNLHISRN